MTFPANFSDRLVRIEYANMAKINRIRAWARRNNATVNVNRYARDAYEGTVVVHSPWNEGRDVTDAREAALRAVIKGS